MNNITGLTKSPGFPGFIAISILAILQRAYGPLSLFAAFSGRDWGLAAKKNLVTGKIFSACCLGAVAVCSVECFLPQDALLDHQYWHYSWPLL